MYSETQIYSSFLKNVMMKLKVISGKTTNKAHNNTVMKLSQIQNNFTRKQIIMQVIKTNQTQ